MKRILTAMFLCALMAAPVWAVAPSAVFLGDGPGVNAPFMDDQAPVTYGLIHSGGGWDFDGTRGIAADGGEFIRYRPTLASDTNNHVSMPTDQDWVFQISQMQETANGGEGPWYIKDEDLDLRIMALGNNADGTYNLLASLPDNSYATVAPNLAIPLGEWGDFVIHYEASSQTLDAYLNGAMVAEDFTVNVASVNWVQAEYERAGQTSFRNIKLGQIPEPATMTLLALGACVALARRRR